MMNRHVLRVGGCGLDTQFWVSRISGSHMENRDLKPRASLRRATSDNYRLKLNSLVYITAYSTLQYSVRYVAGEGN